MHNNIRRLRAFGTRAYWVAAMAWLVTSGPLLFFRREIFSVRWMMSGVNSTNTSRGIAAGSSGVDQALVAVFQRNGKTPHTTRKSNDLLDGFSLGSQRGEQRPNLNLTKILLKDDLQ